MMEDQENAVVDLDADVQQAMIRVSNTYSWITAWGLGQLQIQLAIIWLTNR